MTPGQHRINRREHGSYGPVVKISTGDTRVSPEYRNSKGFRASYFEFVATQ
jgi:hypothetical protein